MREMSNPPLPFDADHESVESRLDARDREGRARAVDPRFNVVLEASAGTGKTRVLVDRYVNLLRAGVDPSNVLAITFTRKAASEMRERVMASLRSAAARGELPAARWRELRDRTTDITVSTIDAFCLSLLREFPLEADLDPGFSMLDETEVPRLVDESLDRTLRICLACTRDDEDVALVFAQLGERRARAGLSSLLHRRIVARRVLSRYLAIGPADLDVQVAARGAAAAMVDLLDAGRGGFDAFIGSGPLTPAFAVLARDLRKLRVAQRGTGPLDPATVQVAFTRIREHFLTQEGTPRTRAPYARTQFANEADWRVHRDLVTQQGEAVRRVLADYRRDTNVLVSRGIWRMFRIADTEYRRTLDAHAALDYSELLLRAMDLLRQMEEFAQSRYRLESRYHHVLVDECQDTSRAQWELVSLLTQSWGEGEGVAHSFPLQPSIFVVGDRKQSIYGFRDADVSVLGEAVRRIGALRAHSDVRRSISRSFRAVPSLLSFVNDVCCDLDKTPDRGDSFVYGEEDRFPLAGVDAAAVPDPDAGIGIVVADTPEECAEITAAEIARLVATTATIRDRDTGVGRPVRPGDVAILFRTRNSHREFEAALARRHVATYVYKGLGFFDADEIKDVRALLWYLAEPLSDRCAAALMRSRFISLSDEGLRLLAPELANALRVARPPTAMGQLDAADARTLIEARTATLRWRDLVDRIPPAELLDLILDESAYRLELRGSRFRQARENLKKIRALVRRIQNRGYATLGRLAAHLDRLAVGDEANAVIDAVDAVSLMTVHASKGLEFPVVFLVNLTRGTGHRRDPIRITADPSGDSVSVAVGDFQSESDDESRVRDVEETKRLLYVALTRARDRLYLGATVTDGRIQPGRGSLAEVLPISLLDALTLEAARRGTVRWRASSGAVHRLRPASAEIGRDAALRQARGEASDDRHIAAAPVGSDFAPLTDAAPRRLSIAAAVSETGYGAQRDVAHGPPQESDRLVGTLVHRLLQRFGVEGHGHDALTRDAVSRMLRPDEVAGASADEGPPFDRLADQALAAYRAICGRRDLCELFTSGDRFHEVPFSMHAEGTWLRGTIDCLIRTAPDRMTVLEFKTGRPREGHRAQVDLYRRAAERVFPGCTIEARLVYAGTPRRP
jgi:ATP-dependent helicase/nuclease subunit A